MPKGRIINLNGGNYIVLNNDEEIICRARGKLRCVTVMKDSSFNQNKNKYSNKKDTFQIKLSPKVGDFVDYEIKDGINYIIDVYPRMNQLVRPDISNVDQIILVFAATNPTFSFYLLDLFLVNLEKEKIKPVIIVSKIDLLDSNELSSLKESLSYYEKMGYKVFYVNSKSLDNKDLIMEQLKNKVSILSGQTGAGKSTLINALIPGFTLNTNEISQALGRGKHTTRETTIYRYDGALIGDTPGFSKLDLSSITKEELKNYFIEFKLNCKFSNCEHLLNTPGCLMQEELNNKNILKSRYESYLKMYNDIKESSRKF